VSVSFYVGHRTHVNVWTTELDLVHIECSRILGQWALTGLASRTMDRDNRRRVVTSSFYGKILERPRDANDGSDRLWQFRHR
jgi:hypothetical protein